MDPLVLPIKTPFGFYFYEAQRNEIVSIDKELYNYLYQTIIKKNQDVEVSDECNKRVSELQGFGYLSPSQIKQLEHPQTRTTGVCHFIS